MRGPSQVSDPYGIAEYTNQSAETAAPGVKLKRSDGDVRGNTLLPVRGIPTQAEADAVMRGEAIR